MEIIAEFRDDGASGLRRRRPGLEGMRELARRSGFDVLLTCGPDRLARNSALLHRIRQELAQLRIRTLFLEERAGDEECWAKMGPDVAARAELEDRLAKETVGERSSA